MRDKKMRRRSSSRWSRKLMEPSSWSRAGPTAVSGIGGLGGRVLRGIFGNYLGGGDSGDGARDGFGGRENLGVGGFAVEVLDFGFDLRFEFVAGAAEFIEGAPDLAANLRHLLGPEQ